MFKKVIILGLISIFLTGCFGSGTSTSTLTPDAGESLYSHSNFSVIIPQDWEITESKDFPSNVPKETIVVFGNNIKSEIFTANVNVSIKEVDETVTSSDYAKNSKTQASTSLLSFTEIGNENIEIQYGATPIEGTLLEFSGKKSAAEPIIKFKQLFVVNKEFGYIVTAASIPEEDQTVVKYMDRMINSFSLK